MVDLQTLLDADEARKKLWAIPGVVRIGFGLKESAGEAQPEYAFRVYVLAKRPLDEIEPAERIPPEIDGIPTDVIVLNPRVAHCSSALKPGLEISREAYGIQGWSGSIGCFVQKGGHFYILTNQHVFVPDQGGDVRPAIYQPSRSTCADIACNKPVAHVVGEVAPNAVQAEQQFQTRTYWLDCGVVQLNDGVAFENTIPDIGAVQQTVRDFVGETMSPVPAPPGRAGAQAPATPITVRKRGKTTGMTRGTIVELCFEEQIPAQGGQPASTVIRWELEAVPTAGPRYSQTYEISPREPRSQAEIIAAFHGGTVSATPAGANRLRFEGTLFGDHGDSGSVWVDNDRHVVGLHWAGTFVRVKTISGGQDLDVDILTGRVAACHIRPVLAGLGINEATGIVVGSRTTAADEIAVPGDELAEASILARATEIETAVERSAAGRALLGAVRRHESEVRSLIHHRRPVMLAWHRNKGPAFVAASMNALRGGTTALPVEVAGHRLSDLVEALHDALRIEGSAELRSAVEDEAGLLLELVQTCGTLEEIIDRLESEAEIAAA